jgi:hypothetical protein
MRLRDQILTPFKFQALGILVALGCTMGCGNSTSPADSAKASSSELESAKKSVTNPTKIHGKTLPADTDLSARERRALKQEGQLPAK